MLKRNLSLGLLHCNIVLRVNSTHQSILEKEREREQETSKTWREGGWKKENEAQINFSLLWIEDK